MPFVVPIQVGNAGLSDLNLPVPPFQTIHGTVKLPDPQATWTGSLSVILLGMQAGSHAKSVPIAADGSFALERVPPGQWRLDWRDNDLRLPPSGRKLHVAAARFGTVDVLWAPTPVTESGNP